MSPTLLRFALYEGSNRAGVSIPSNEDANTPSFRNVMYSSYLEFRTLGNVHGFSNPEYSV
jgi:hypothetical protein